MKTTLQREKERPFRAPLPAGKWGPELTNRDDWPAGWEAVETAGRWSLMACRAVRKKTHWYGARYAAEAAWVGKYVRCCSTCARLIASDWTALSAVAVYARRLADPEKLVPAVLPGPLRVRRCGHCLAYLRSPAGQAKVAERAREKAAERQRRRRARLAAGNVL
jgi:hypothetical protein